MQEQENKEKVLQMINIYAVNQYLQRMIVSKTKKLVLDQGGKKVEVSILEDYSTLVSLEKTEN